MGTEAQVIESFMAMWDEPGGFAAGVKQYFTQDTRYENVGMSTATGIEEALKLSPDLAA